MLLLFLSPAFSGCFVFATVLQLAPQFLLSLLLFLGDQPFSPWSPHELIFGSHWSHTHLERQAVTEPSMRKPLKVGLIHHVYRWQMDRGAHFLHEHVSVPVIFLQEVVVVQSPVTRRCVLLVLPNRWFHRHVKCCCGAKSHGTRCRCRHSIFNTTLVVSVAIAFS